MTEHQKQLRTGFLLGLGAYGAWGVLPIYFKALGGVAATEIVAHRIVWSVLVLALLLTVTRRWSHFKASLLQPRLILALAISAVLIAVNWLTLVWAISVSHVLAASLGYYLNPLVNVLLGVALLGERLSRVQILAVGLAAAGIAVLAFGALSTLWISLALAASFSAYGLVRKIAPVEAVEGLSIETVLLAPFALAYLLLLHQKGEAGFGSAPAIDALLVLSGAITVVPLLMFTAAAKRLAYSTLGFIQFVAPTLNFVLAVALFGERLTTAHLICFAAIWVAVALFMLEALGRGRAALRERKGLQQTPAESVEGMGL